MRRPGSETLQWIGLAAAPLAWAAHLVIGFYVTVAACEGGRALSLVSWSVGLTAAAVTVAIAGQAAAVAAWRETRHADAPPASRIHFLADAALLSNTLFIVLILLEGISAAELGLCRQA